MYYSLNTPSLKADFKTATIQGQAPDGGLYFPEQIPMLASEFLQNLRHLSREAIAYEVIRPYVANSLSDAILKSIVEATVAFPIPLKNIHDDIYSLELFHGPTLAFKDIGARFMSRCLGQFAKEKKQDVVVLVATSGDTGGAVASGFHRVEGVQVVILYPSGKVSSVQEQQLTGFGDNIHAIEVDGNFDDCQQMVKQAFRDEELKQRIFLTSANSINVARWLPQQFYYFFALQQWEHKEPPVFVVPSGNFGNICAGVLAQQSGLPVDRFIAACNANDVVPRFLETGDYAPQKAIPTISNAMDVGNPSNFVRIQEIARRAQVSVSDLLISYKSSDAATKEQIAQVYKQHAYLLDPHGAVGYDAFIQFRKSHPNAPGILLETAHPIKFLDVVEPIIGQPIPIPDSIAETLKKRKNASQLQAEYPALRNYLLNSNLF